MDNEEVLDAVQQLVLDLASIQGEIPDATYDRIMCGAVTVSSAALNYATTVASDRIREEILTRMRDLKPGLTITRHTLVAPMRPRYTTDEISATLDELEAEGVIVSELLTPNGRGRPARVYRLAERRIEPTPERSFADRMSALRATTQED